MIVAITSLLLIIWSIDSASAASGKATYYGGNPSGNACGYATVPTSTFPYGYYAACGGSVFNSGKGCGKCFKITCIGPYSYNPSCFCDPDTPSVTISCMDQCPECSATHFDLDPTAMTRIVGDGLAGTCGVIEIDIEEVECDYSRNIQIRAKSGTSAYWYGLHIDYIGGSGAVSKVEIKSSGSSSYGTTCDKSEGPSFWICSGGFPLQTPLSMRLTADSGDQITCTNCITNLNGGASFDFGTNFNGGSGSTPSSPTKKPTARPTSRNTPAPVPTSPPVSSGGGGKIKIKENGNSNQWWLAIEFPDNDNSVITNLEFRDSNHPSWVEGNFESWGSGAYSFGNTGSQFSGKQHFRVTTSKGKAVSWNVFNGISDAGSDAYIDLPASAYTEEEGAASSSQIAGIVAGIIVSLLCVLCIGGGIYYYKTRWNKNKGQASFNATDTDTPTPKETKQDEAEIEVEMNVEYTNETTR